MKRLTVLLAALLLSPAAAPAAPGPAAIAWRSWDAGMREAVASKRPVLVDVYTDWCVWCKRLDRDVYSKPEVRDYLTKRFVTIRLNAEGNERASFEGQNWTARTLASNRFRITGYPTTMFLRPSGKDVEHLANVPGYLPPDRFLLLLRYVGDGALDRGQSFDDFVKSTGASDGP